MSISIPGWYISLFLQAPNHFTGPGNRLIILHNYFALLKSIKILPTGFFFFPKQISFNYLDTFHFQPPPPNCQLSKAEPLLGQNMKYTCRIKQKQSLKLCWYIQCITSFFYHNIHILASIHKKWVFFRPLQTYHLCVTKTIQATKFLSIEKHLGIRLPVMYKKWSSQVFK